MWSRQSKINERESPGSKTAIPRNFAPAKISHCTEGSDTPTKSVRDFEISGFHGRFRDFSEDFEISLEISRFPLRFRDFS